MAKYVINEGYLDGTETVEADDWYEKDNFVIFVTVAGDKLHARRVEGVFSVDRVDADK